MGRCCDQDEVKVKHAAEEYQIYGHSWDVENYLSAIIKAVAQRSPRGGQLGGRSSPLISACLLDHFST